MTRNRYANKRMMVRTHTGQFRRAVGEDIGIMGVCPVCNHFLLRHYAGNPTDPHPDPRAFVNRCFTCQPETQTEIDAKPKPTPRPSFLDIIRAAEEGKK